MKDRIIGVDLGGTQIRAVLTNREGHKLDRVQRPTQAEQGPDVVIERILKTIEDVLPEDGTTNVIGIGIGGPGPVDPVTGTLFDPPNISDWNAVSLKDRIEAAFPLPIFVGNDANVAALGEHRFGAGRGVDHFVYVTVSTGIGGGIISDGRLLTGARGFAGEVGHQTLDPDGPICGCGQRGHLEALASGTAIGRDARQILRAGTESRMTGMVDSIESVTAKTVSQAAAEGDEVALEILRRAAFYLGLGLTNVIHTVEPARIALGGGVTQAGDLLFEPVRETVREHYMSDAYEGVEIVPAKLGDDVGLLGAVALVLTELEK